MFNKKEIAEIKQTTESLNNRLNDINFLLRESGIQWVDNYFKDCPCCVGEPQKILLSKAKSFRKIEISNPVYFFGMVWTTHYTTENSYKLHEKKIKEWEVEKI